MKKTKILIIEDEISICDIISYKLKKEGYTVRSVTQGKEGLAEIKNFKPDLIILDIMLPDMSGFDICKEITVNYKIPIIMLTARNDIIDKILGLELGADDYITKPFDIREVAVRVKAVLRRIKSISESETNVIKIKVGMEIDTASRKVFKNSEEIKLKPREFDLLLMLLENKNRVLKREQLLDKVWGYDFKGSLRTVDVHIQRLRKKLDDENCNSIIETAFGIGYMLRCEK